MSDLTRRPDRSPRRARERRAFQLVVAGGSAAVVAIVGFVLSLFGVIGSGLWVIAAIVAIVCVFLFRRTVARG
jgi:FtsH-binding integral membrane protein